MAKDNPIKGIYIATADISVVIAKPLNKSFDISSCSESGKKNFTFKRHHPSSTPPHARNFGHNEA
jgi:hypothetical protein